MINLKQRKMKTFKWTFLILFSLFTTISCKKETELFINDENTITSGVNNNTTNFVLPDSIEIKIDLPKWGWTVHDNMTYYCAKQWGLSEERAKIIYNAAHMPDVYDVEGQIPGTNNWLHGWVQIVNGVWVWGAADKACYNNIQGSGWNNGSSFYYYSAGNKSKGDWYLGYASHYLEDCGNPWHTSANIVQQLSTHSNFEVWVDNNWSSGHEFYLDVMNDHYYYSVSDIKEAVKALAKYSNSHNTTIYNAYVASGKPTAAGTGNSTLISETRQLLVQSSRYVKGLIKYTLDKKQAW